MTGSLLRTLCGLALVTPLEDSIRPPMMLGFQQRHERMDRPLSKRLRPDLRILLAGPFTRNPTVDLARDTDLQHQADALARGALALNELGNRNIVAHTARPP
jgi:hypothetical protein